MGWAIIECPCCGARMELGKHISMQTRADGIRSMTDEELAMKLSEIEYSAVMSDKAWHPAKWLDWLKQEVEE